MAPRVSSRGAKDSKSRGLPHRLHCCAHGPASRFLSDGLRFVEDSILQNPECRIGRNRQGPLQEAGGPPPERAGPVRNPEQVTRRKRAQYSMMPDCSQPHGGNASALAAIRISSKLTWRDLSLQVCRQSLCRPRENAGGWAGGRFEHLSYERIVHVQNGVLRTKPQKIPDNE